MQKYFQRRVGGQGWGADEYQRYGAVVGGRVWVPLQKKMELYYSYGFGAPVLQFQIWDVVEGQ